MNLNGLFRKFSNPEQLTLCALDQCCCLCGGVQGCTSIIQPECAIFYPISHHLISSLNINSYE